jgi:hypothetical protein
MIRRSGTIFRRPFRERLSSYRFQVPGSRFQVQGSRFKVPGSRFKVPGSRFKVPGSRLLSDYIVRRELHDLTELVNKPARIEKYFSPKDYLNVGYIWNPVI